MAFGLGSRVLVDVEQTGGCGSVGEHGWPGATKTYHWSALIRPASRLRRPPAGPAARWVVDADLFVDDLGAPRDASLADHEIVVRDDVDLAIVTPTE
jgi:hypothetical protein